MKKLLTFVIIFVCFSACQSFQYGPKPPVKKPLPTSWKKPSPAFFKQKAHRVKV